MGAGLMARLICWLGLHKGVGTNIAHTYQCPRCDRTWSVVVW